MKKSVSFIWDNTCQEAFKEIKKYLTHPPILVVPVSGKPFLLYGTDAEIKERINASMSSYTSNF